MKKKLFLGAIIICIIVAVWFIFKKNHDSAEPQFTFAKVTRGNIETTISSTGTLNARGTVEVGTQVSGIIEKVLVDFNDNVQKNQVLAVLDTIKLAVEVREAEANLQKFTAQYEQAKYEYERNANLFKQKLISEQDYIQAGTSLKTADATLKIARIAHERALFNLSYAFIRSPIDGKVIYRNVEQGQTVAASFSTPTIFTIAKDLTQMEIRALVDESDIGLIQEGQKARFTVQSYPEWTFSGVVRQIWLQPETVQNVVNYTVVVDAINAEELLLPGMTATIDFVVEHKENVLMIPNGALKVQPSAEMMAALRANRPPDFGGPEDSFAVRPRPHPSGQSDTAPEKARFLLPGKQMPANSAPLFYLDEQNQLQITIVRTGVSDSKNTEIIAGRNISEGMSVISGLKSTKVAGDDKSESNNRAPRFGPPPF